MGKRDLIIRLTGGLMLVCLQLSCRGNAFLDTSEEGEDPNNTGATDSETGDTATGMDARMGIGKACTTNEDCFSGVICSNFDHTCQYPGMPGTYSEGAACMANLFCAIGLACAADGVCVTAGSAGTGQIGSSCSATEDCALGYICRDNVCFGYDPVYWNGATCSVPSEEGDFVAYFDVNRETGEFYRFPFPNDSAVVNGHIDLTGHTNPGVLNEGLGNITGAYIDYVQKEMKGFGTQSNVYFRMSHNPDWDSIDLGDNAYIVDIDSDSPDYGEKRSAGFRGNTAAQMYICHNWLSLKPTLGKPLRQNTTYAAILETDIEDLNGNRLRPDPNFTAMLSSTGPGTGRAQSTWNVYAPMRNWVADQKVDTSRIAVASVFTTQTFDVLPRLRAQVRSEALPKLVGGVPVRDDSALAYTTYSGTVTVPFFQNGIRPFIVSGGQVAFDANGAPIVVANDNVPFALTVPKDDPPENGWPVFLYAHGTDGSETSFIANGVAENMAKIGVAVISMLQVQHGIRRQIPGGLETDETQPSMLFYNFRNPHAAIGNNYQAAADYFQLVRFVEEFSTITGEDIIFNTQKLYYFGHSQGTQGQYLAAVHEPMIKGIVLSGSGGYLTESLLGKKQPIDLSVAVSYLLMDPNVDDAHPVLSLIQASMEQVDPVNYSPAAFRNEWPGMTYPGRDLFMSFGIEDSYAPFNTQKALARALGLRMDYVDGDYEISGLQEIKDFPYADSRTVNDVKITTVGIQYKPDGDYDGHFVLFRNRDAMTQLSHFVQTMVADDTVAEVINP